jgi:two-component system response regulator AtoC
MAASILIIDDEVLTLNNLKRVLEKVGYEILLADSGETGIEVFKKHRPNLKRNRCKYCGYNDNCV